MDRKKLDAFIKYVKAYLKILNNFKNQYNWQTIYFDGFAGSGKRKVYKEDIELFENVFNEDYVYIYEGSVSRILNLKEPFIFDWYYFVDTNKKYIEDLNEIKKNIAHIKKNRIIIRNDNCNSQLGQLAQALKNNRKLAALIFLDPFGMQVDWKVINELRNTRSDIWILLPSGVGINRLLDKKKQLKHRKRLENFLGLSIEKIEDIFYQSTNENTLFGIQEKTMKINDSINKIVEIYIQQLKTVWKFVTKQPLVLMNSKNVPIFHFLFASNNKTALEIASEIIDKR